MRTRKRGRITVQSQPTKEARVVRRVAAIPFLIVSVFFVIIGVTTLIPQAGLFGVVWTIVAVFFAGFGVYNLVRKNDVPHRVGYDVETDLDRSIVGIMEDVPETGTSGDTVQSRLEQLQVLYEKRLITQEEYDRKREEILKDL